MTAPIPTLDALREMSRAATPGLAFVRGETADVIFHPPGSSFVGDQTLVAKCATGDHWLRNAAFIANAVNYVRALLEENTGCAHPNTVTHSTLDDDDVEFCPDCGKNVALNGVKLPAPEPSPADDDCVIVFDYRNHRGQKGRRRVAGPLTVWHGKTKWHPLPQWFLGGHCLDQDAHRDFALADCRFAPETPLTHLRESQSVPDNVAIIVLPDGAIFYVGPIKQVPSEAVIPHGSVVNLSPKDYASVQRRMKNETPIATIEH